MTPHTSPCDECNGTGLVGGHRGQTPESYEEVTEPCPRIRCIAGQIELTDAEVKAMEAEQANVRS